MRHTFIGAAAVAASLAWGGAALAEAPTLKFGTTAPPGSHIAKWFDAWVEDVNKVAPDAVKVKVYHNTLGNTRTIYDSIKNRIADFGWFNPGYYPGQFHKIDVTAMPGVILKAEYGSVALWRMYDKGAFGDEFNLVRPIGFHAYPPGSLHTNFPVTDMASLKGKKFGMSSRIDGEILQALGATPISVGLFDFYQSLQNRVVDGVVSQWTAFQPFKLQEVTKYHVDFALGSAAALIAFNNDAWKELSADAQKAIMSKSGETMSRGLGKFWDGVSDEAMNEALKTPGHQLVKLSPEEKAKWYKAIEPAFDEWRKTTQGSDEVTKALHAQYDAAEKGVTN